MRDVHVHFLHGKGGGYNIDFFEGFIKTAQNRGLDEIYLLEHTHQFIEFEKVYEPIKTYNEYQRNWICESGLFTGLAHPDSIKCFGYIPDIDLTDYYNELSVLLCKHGMYAENSGGLRLNYCSDLELGLNPKLLSVFQKNNVKIATASDAHKQSDVGVNILELENMLKD